MCTLSDVIADTVRRKSSRRLGNTHVYSQWEFCLEGIQIVTRIEVDYHCLVVILHSYDLVQIHLPTEGPLRGIAYRLRAIGLNVRIRKGVLLHDGQKMPHYTYFKMPDTIKSISDHERD